MHNIFLTRVSSCSRSTHGVALFTILHMNSTFQDRKVEIVEKWPDVLARFVLCHARLQCMHDSYTFLKNCIIIALIQQFFAAAGASFVLHGWNIFSAFLWLLFISQKELLNNKWKSHLLCIFFSHRQFLETREERQNCNFWIFLHEIVCEISWIQYYGTG